MMSALVLWGHAFAALAFGVLAIDQARRPAQGWPKAAFVAALFATACWALAVAGIDARDIATRLAEGVRNVAWLGFMVALVRRDRAGGSALGAVYLVAIGMTVAVVFLSLVGTLSLSEEGVAAVADARVACRMMGAIAALVLVHHLASAASASVRRRLEPVLWALAIMWSADLVVAATVYATAGWPTPLIVMRGFAMVAAAASIGVAIRRGGEWRFTLSRMATLRSLSALAIIAYAGGTVALTNLADAVGGGYSRAAQTAVVFASTAALMTLLSTPWLRAWTKVKISKHLFSHRYDYRTEWQRFTTTLGVPGAGADPLDRRVVKAVADLTDSPAGLLLVRDDAGLGSAAAWRWEGHGSADATLVRYLADTGRIVELDAVRAGSARDDAPHIPDWMIRRDDAWALVPLLHGSELVGAILLARPPVDRSLDWEDLDLLRVAGRQAASYFAEDRAHRALAEAARFEEFNRRFAFIIHDIKNLVSGLTLVARNAERHADNPAFRADMVATLQDSAVRMNALLARLSQHHQPAPEAVQPVDVGALTQRIAVSRRAQHRVDANGAGVALAQPGRLEQVLGHLVQNAVEASAADAVVSIAVERRETSVVIDIIDAGCGMSPAFLRDELFRPFASSKAEGFGIGAYEARQLTKAMGGSIEVKSEEGCGTHFRIRLPVAPALEVAA